MAPHEPDTRKEARRHAGPLIGMALVVLFGVGLILYWQFEEAAQGASPGNELSDQPEPRPNDATNPPRPVD